MRHPEVAIRWADVCYDTDHSFELLWGPFGLVLDKSPAGIVSVNPPPPGQTPDEFRYTHTPVISTPLALFAADLQNFVWARNQVRKFERFDVYSQFFPAFNEIFPPAFFSSAENDELAMLRTDVQQYARRMRALFITGAEPLNDASWNNYVQTLNRAGVQRYIAIHQDAHDRFNR
jgi:putative aldouronate transport system substrate-binding protein